MSLSLCLNLAQCSALNSAKCAWKGFVRLAYDANAPRSRTNGRRIADFRLRRLFPIEFDHMGVVNFRAGNQYKCVNQNFRVVP